MVTKQQLQSMDPYEFEELVADLWKSKGYTTNVRKKSGDKAVDIDAERGGRKEVIQVKRYSDGNKIGSEEVRKYATLYQQTDANQVVLVTSGQFTNDARKLADDLGVEIKNGGQIAQELDDAGLSPRTYGIQDSQKGTTGDNTTSSEASQPTINWGSLLGSLFAAIVVIALILVFLDTVHNAIAWGVDPIISVFELGDEAAETLVTYSFIGLVAFILFIAVSQEAGLDNKTGNLLALSAVALVIVPLVLGRLVEDFVGPVGREGIIGTVVIGLVSLYIIFLGYNNLRGAEPTDTE